MAHKNNIQRGRYLLALTFLAMERIFKKEEKDVRFCTCISA
jgi:hypothetical protein